LLYRFESSADYDPAPQLEKIQAAVLSINFADDALNPIELGFIERAKPHVRNGQFIVVPSGPETTGHMTLTDPAVYAKHIGDFLAQRGL
jgi:homoserine O-acetyltransferase